MKKFSKLFAITIAGALLTAGIGFAVASYQINNSITPVVARDSSTTISWSPADGATTDYTFVSVNGKNGTDYYQDKSGSVGLDLYLKKSSGNLWSTAPSSASLTVKVGGGSTKDPLTNNVTAYFIDSNQNMISSEETIVTTKVESKTGTEYTVSITPVANAYGIMIHHSKESGYNIRVYSFSLTYTDGGSSATLESISIDGSLNTTSYAYGQGWSRKGLSVIGHYSDGSDAAITSGVTWSYDSNCAVLGITSLTITATYNSLTATHTEPITVSKIASPYLNGLAYRMYFTNSSTNYYFTGAMSGYYGATSTTDTDGVETYFEANGDGQNIYFYNGSTKNYIAAIQSGTHINFNFSTSVPASAWYYNGSTMVYYLSETSQLYGTGSYSSYTTFSASPSYYTSNYWAKFSLVNALTASDFANQFLSVLSCDSTGESTPTFNNYYKWSDLVSLYALLGDTEKTTLKNASANAGGTNIEQCAAAYDYILAKYGVTDYENFLDRSVASKSAYRRSLLKTEGKDSFIFVGGAAALLGAASIFGFIRIKSKKKEDR